GDQTCALPISHTHTHTHLHPPTHTHTHTHTLSLSISLSLSYPSFLSLTQTHTLTPTLYHTHTHTLRHGMDGYTDLTQGSAKRQGDCDRQLLRKTKSFAHTHT